MLTQEKSAAEPLPARKKASRAVLAILFMAAGVLHFAAPTPYARIVPPFLPNPRLLVAISGICEFLGGAGILILPVRRFAGYGLIALLIAVFPANINMAYQAWRVQGATLSTLLLLLRLPLQIPLIFWVRSAALRANS